MAKHRNAAWRWWEDYGDGIVDPGDPRLVPVPSIQGRDCRLHWAAAAAFRALAADWATDRPHLPPMLVASGWRPHRWASREQYESAVISRYGSVAQGQVWLAYRSAHETGLVLDLGSPPPMRPDKRWVDAQLQSNVYSWLMAHAPARGLRCYLPEPWHWELPLPAEVWRAAGPELPLAH